MCCLINKYVNVKAKFSRICDTFDEMSQKVSLTPDTVAELVDLQNYVFECRDVTMYNLREKIRLTAEYVTFLMMFAHLSSKL